MNNFSKLLLGTVLATFVTGSVVRADEPAVDGAKAKKHHGKKGEKAARAAKAKNRKRKKTKEVKEEKTERSQNKLLSEFDETLGSVVAFPSVFAFSPRRFEIYVVF